MIVLASASPRRAELFSMLGLDYVVRPSNGEEIVPSNATPEQVVMNIARCKGQGIDGTVVSADTIVYFNNKVLGKPRDKDDAYSMLKLLSGNTHLVYTGLFVKKDDIELLDYEKTEVTFRSISDVEIINYIETGEPMDKAGAYGAQGKGSLFVEKINGDFFNVMGLPICKLGEMLKTIGEEIL